ncbi:MAG: cell division protein FtsZ [Candidatus Pacebacteria bacterium]|nr:cell division protein FtsZ [Candidatus Paceibacterota bacterium]
MTSTKIKVIGVGGSGCNTISRLMQANIKNVELISVNTDAQDLKKKNAHLKLRIGKQATKGLGAGMNPELGKLSAKENAKEIEDVLAGADIIFLTAGLGGGTGSGAAPIIADLAKKGGVLTIGVITLPFAFEGKKRKRIALNSLEEIKKSIDTVVVIPNDKLVDLVPPKSSVETAFAKCDELLKEAVEGISNVILNPGILNLDFADIKEVLKKGGIAYFGIGRAEGKDRMNKAIDQAIYSPINSFSLEKTTGLLINVSSGTSNLYLSEIKKIADTIRKRVPAGAKIIFGACFDKSLKKDEIRITIIATGSA